MDGAVDLAHWSAHGPKERKRWSTGDEMSSWRYVDDEDGLKTYELAWVFWEKPGRAGRTRRIQNGVESGYRKGSKFHSHMI